MSGLNCFLTSEALEDEEVRFAVFSGTKEGERGCSGPSFLGRVWEGAVCTVYRYSLASKPLAGNPARGAQHSHKPNTEACFLCCVE